MGNIKQKWTQSWALTLQLQYQSVGLHNFELKNGIFERLRKSCRNGK